MHTTRLFHAAAVATLFAASSASFAATATTVAAASPIPQVIVTAKRLTMHQKIMMTLEDVRDAAKRLAGTQRKSSAAADNLG